MKKFWIVHTIFFIVYGIILASVGFDFSRLNWWSLVYLFVWVIVTTILLPKRNKKTIR